MKNDNNLLDFDKKKIRDLDFFWLGFVIYILAYNLSQVTIGISIFPILQVLGLFLMVFTIPQLIQFKFESFYLRFFFVSYCLWLFVTILRGISFNYSFLRVFFLDASYGGIIFLSPLILLFPANLTFYKKVFDTIYILGIFYIIYAAIFIKLLLNSDRSSVISQGVVENLSDLAFPCGFLLFTYFYHSKKKQLLAIFVTTLALMFAIVRARRGMIFMFGSIFLFSYLLFIFNSKKKLTIIYLTLLFALLGTFYISGIYKPLENRFFGYLVDRGSEDTRSSVELYFYDDMKTADWIVGRGINGEYFCPSVDEDQLTNYRNVIETGYLQIILKGGIISLGLFLLISVPAVILGLFDSRNNLSKASAIWILLSIVNLYPASVNSFSMKYLLVWIGIGICYSKHIRNLPDKFVLDVFKSKI